MAGMELVVGQHCHLDYHLRYCRRDQCHLVEQRRTGVREDYVALGGGIQ